ncbi:hypothetical protein [Dysgonomonas macrotermitis]|uniref:Uncharacterized protein n=1 Tax=Dysgonomonas macrotermitis TaxID=1346286 RepID=A0A1M4XWV1_9BACT|nr:hypothetical protein [Dysgonomonas macrotermitis]SHE97712.1 hypothetical protein SAMN05444362_1034 [Dysgonomonas macrotermitis]
MQSVQSYFRSLYFTHGILTLLLGAFLAFTKWEIIPYREDEFDIPFLISDAMIIVLGLIYAFIYLGKKNKSAKYRRGLGDKLTVYKKGLVVSWVIMAVMTLFSIASYIMTGDEKFVYVSLFCVLVLLLNRPTVGRTIRNLKLEDDEIEVLQNPFSAL